MKPNRCKKPVEGAGTEFVCGEDAGHADDVPCGKPWRPWRRGSYLPFPQADMLDQACSVVNNAFGGCFGCYHVGSSLERRDYRDVDVRLILSDEAYAAIFGAGPRDAGHRGALWSLMCVSISGWFRQQTGLPVDFQIQQQTLANSQHEGIRSALGFQIAGKWPGDDEK